MGNQRAGGGGGGGAERPSWLAEARERKKASRRTRDASGPRCFSLYRIAAMHLRPRLVSALPSSPSVPPRFLEGAQFCPPLRFTEPHVKIEQQVLVIPPVMPANTVK